MMKEAVKRTKVGTCFVAGTLVHTQTSLVPIEQIKVGDYVLSKPESGEGELSYQKVTKTFVHENQPILCVIVYPEREVVAAAVECRLIGKSLFIPLLVTQNHPFWVEGKGWIDASKLNIGVDKLRLADGTLAFLDDVNTVMQMDNPNGGWLMEGIRCPIRRSDVNAHWIDFSANQVIGHLGISDRIENNAIEWCDQNPEDHLLRTVYNIEVENTHTYFVGTEGIWVHNKNAFR